MPGTGDTVMKRQTSLPAFGKQVNKQIFDPGRLLRDDTEAETRRCEGMGPGGRALRQVGQCLQSPWGEVERQPICSHVERGQGFAFYAEQAGKSADGLVQKSDMV